MTSNTDRLTYYQQRTIWALVVLALAAIFGPDGVKASGNGNSNDCR